jgi:hypothetical protein
VKRQGLDESFTVGNSDNSIKNIDFEKSRPRTIMNAIDELRYMNLQDLYEKMRLSNQEFDDWLKSMGLLHAFQVCDFCGDFSTYGRNSPRFTHVIDEMPAT